MRPQAAVGFVRIAMVTQAGRIVTNVNLVSIVETMRTSARIAAATH